MSTFISSVNTGVGDGGFIINGVTATVAGNGSATLVVQYAIVPLA